MNIAAVGELPCSLDTAPTSWLKLSISNGEEVQAAFTAHSSQQTSFRMARWEY